MSRGIKLLEKLSHPLTVRLIRVCEVKNTNKLLLFKQPSSLGSLEVYIRSNGPVPEDRAKKWSRDVITAVGFLHHLVTHTVSCYIPDALQEIGD